MDKAAKSKKQKAASSSEDDDVQMIHVSEPASRIICVDTSLDTDDEG